MARVLCDLAFPLERAQDVLAGAGVTVESSALPWAGDDVVGLLSWEPVKAADLARLPSLRVIATPSVGVDHLDVEAATERGIWVCNVPDYCVDEMADHALALLLTLVRGVVELDRSVRAGAWDHEAAGVLRRLSDVRLGVIGFGRIGRALAVRARSVGMDVCAHDPLVPAETMETAGVRAVSLADLLETSTAISIHAPLTRDTQGMIGRRELEALPRGAFVVNVSRGGLVDVEALREALESGHLAGAALDVLEVEPPTPTAAAPQAPRLVVTPHAGWYSEAAEEAVFRRASEAVRDALEGRSPRCAVNRPS